MEHLFAWGHRNFLPAQRFWAEYKTSFPLFLGNGLFLATDTHGKVIMKSSSAQWKNEALFFWTEGAAPPNSVSVVCIGESDAEQSTDASPQGLLNTQTFD